MKISWMMSTLKNRSSLDKQRLERKKKTPKKKETQIGFIDDRLHVVHKSLHTKSLD